MIARDVRYLSSTILFNFLYLTIMFFFLFLVEIISKGSTYSFIVFMSCCKFMNSKLDIVFNSFYNFFPFV